MTALRMRNSHRKCLQMQLEMLKNIYNTPLQYTLKKNTVSLLPDARFHLCSHISPYYVHIYTFCKISSLIFDLINKKIFWCTARLRAAGP